MIYSILFSVQINQMKEQLYKLRKRKKKPLSEIGYKNTERKKKRRKKSKRKPKRHPGAAVVLPMVSRSRKKYSKTKDGIPTQEDLIGQW